MKVAAEVKICERALCLNKLFYGFNFMNSFIALMLKDKADAAEVIHCTEQMC